MRNLLIHAVMVGTVLVGVRVGGAHAGTLSQRALGTVDTRANRKLIRQVGTRLVFATHSRLLPKLNPAASNQWIVERLKLTPVGVVAERYHTSDPRKEMIPEETDIKTPGRPLHNYRLGWVGGVSLTEFTSGRLPGGEQFYDSDRVGRAFKLDPKKVAARVERYRRKYAP
jgi:hypothetical protein